MPAASRENTAHVPPAAHSAVMVTGKRLLLGTLPT